MLVSYLSYLKVQEHNNVILLSQHAKYKLIQVKKNNLNTSIGWSIISAKCEMTFECSDNAFRIIFELSVKNLTAFTNFLFSHLIKTFSFVPDHKSGSLSSDADVIMSIAFSICLFIACSIRWKLSLSIVSAISKFSILALRV